MNIILFVTNIAFSFYITLCYAQKTQNQRAFSSIIFALCYLLSVLCALYSKEVPASLALRRGRVDKANFSQPARHHILRCCVRPFAVALVDKTQLTTCVFRDPRGATYAALRVTYRYAHCRLLVVAELLKHILLFQLFCYYEQFIIPLLAEAFD